jgi:hypothetical protein
MNITIKAFALKHGIKIFKLQNKMHTKIGKLCAVQGYKHTRFGNVPLYDYNDLMTLLESTKKSDAVLEKREVFTHGFVDSSDHKKDFYEHQIQKQHAAAIKSLSIYG